MLQVECTLTSFLIVAGHHVARFLLNVISVFIQTLMRQICFDNCVGIYILVLFLCHPVIIMQAAIFCPPYGICII